jgi:hypothetical protein
MDIIFDAEYREKATGNIVVVLGLKSSGVVVRDKCTDALSTFKDADFLTRYEDTGVHDHKKSCCTVHETHTSPHMGCILR